MEGTNSIINAWKIYQLRSAGKIPGCYTGPSAGVWPAADRLVHYLRNELERPT
jgi:hypothetical protein